MNETQEAVRGQQLCIDECWWVSLRGACVRARECSHVCASSHVVRVLLYLMRACVCVCVCVCGGVVFLKTQDPHVFRTSRVQ